MKPVSLSERESVVIGTKFEYFPPEPYSDEAAFCWRYLDSEAKAEDLPVLKELAKKRLVWHMEASDWDFLSGCGSCWALTESGLGIFNWFHSFPENYGA